MKNFIAISLNCITTVSSCLLVFTIYLLLNSFLAEKEEEKTFVIETIKWCGVFEPAPSSMEEIGKTLFKNNCASCHNKDMKSKMTGTALGGG